MNLYFFFVSAFSFQTLGSCLNMLFPCWNWEACRLVLLVHLLHHLVHLLHLQDLRQRPQLNQREEKNDHCERLHGKPFCNNGRFLRRVFTQVFTSGSVEVFVSRLSFWTCVGLSGPSVVLVNGTGGGARQASFQLPTPIPFFLGLYKSGRPLEKKSQSDCIKTKTQSYEWGANI